MKPLTRIALLATAAVAALAADTVTRSGGATARAAEVRTLFRKQLAAIEPRFGVIHESLVVLPLVLREPPDDPEPAHISPAGDARWKRGPLFESAVDLSTAAPAAQQRFVPAGTLLEGGDRERLLTRGVPLFGEEHAITTSAVCDTRRKGAEPEPTQSAQRLAPLEQRKLLLLDNQDGLLPVLQRVQCCLSGARMEAETLGEVIGAPKIAGGENERRPVLAKLAGAYGGQTVGHVAYFGFRPVEVVVYARPADYRAMAPLHLRSLAISHAFWEQAIGTAAVKASDTDVRRLVTLTSQMLEGFAKLHVRGALAQTGERVRWHEHRGGVQCAAGADGRVEPFVCRLLTDDAGEFAYFEAIENGPEIVYAQPYRSPGGRPVSEPPSNKGNGPWTIEALERVLERLRERRERAELDRARRAAEER